MSKAALSLFLPALYGGGAERVMVRLAREFAYRNIPVDMVLARAVGPYLAHLPAQVAVIDLGCARTIASLPRLMRYLKRTRPCALLSTMAHANVVALAARRLSRAPTRIAVRETVAPLSQALHLRTFSARLVVIATRAYRAADTIIVNSQQVGEELSQLLRMPLTAFRLIPNPVVEPELYALAQQPVAHPWFEDPQVPVILGVGRLTLQKDFATLIQAVALLNQSIECRLVILGEGEQRHELERLVERLSLENKVWMPGFEPNPYRYMARAAVFALTSRWEGSPNALIEALACGAPVVATDCPGGTREVLEGGRWGTLTPVGNPEAIAAAIAQVLHAPPAPEPLQQYAQRFAVSAVADQYLHALRLI